MGASEEEIRITLRLSAALRDRLTQSASQNSRSMNGEIVDRLEKSFDHLDEHANPDLLKLRAAFDQEKAVNAALQKNFEVLAAQLAGPVGENRDEVLRVLSALRILGIKVPQ